MKREEKIKGQIGKKEKKAELRKQILKNRDAIRPETKRLWDERIFMNLKAYELDAPCRTYLCYVSYKSEVSTKEWIDWCLREGKTVFVPKVADRQECPAGTTEKGRNAAASPEKGREMEFYRIFSPEDLTEGYRGILEPAGSAERAFSAWMKQTDGKEKIRMLLPGAVFDRRGNRIGYGGGFYDRWLGKRGKAQKIGLAYQLQLAEEIPAESFDRRADLLITEEGLINCAGHM